jgi:hypothetical protein
MGVSYVRFRGQGMGGRSCTRGYSPPPEQKIAKINEKIMISLMQW